MEKNVGIGSKFTLVECCKKTKETRDVISRLPDEIIVSILTHLSLKDAASSSLLSSRWNHLWVFTSRLDFDATDRLRMLAQNDSKLKNRECLKLYRMERKKYARWINHVLKLHKSSTLEEFRVCFPLDDDSQYVIDYWLEYAFMTGIQSLELDFRRVIPNLRHPNGCYTLVTKLFMQKSHFGQPHLNHNLQVGVFNGFKSLKSLTLKSLNVTGEVLKCILFNCLDLKRLVLDGVGKLVNVEICGPSLALKYLEITHCVNLKTVKLSDINLISFTFMGSRCLVKLNNLPLLVELQYGVVYYLRDAIPLISSYISQLEVLTLCTDNAKNTSDLKDFPALNRLKKLVLIVHPDGEGSLMGFASLIKASPFLQRFVLQTIWDNETTGIKRKIREPRYCPHGNLKVVELVGYTGRASELEAAMYIIENAVALEQLIIDPRDQLGIDDLDRDPMDEDTIRWEEGARKRAREQLEGKVPSHKLLIL